jgi:hypothetical protein
MSLWTLIIVIVMKTGEVFAVAQVSNTPEYNNQASCEAAGTLKVDQEQIKIGSDNGTVFFKCQEITEAQINAATGKGSKKQDGSTF